MRAARTHPEQARYPVPLAKLGMTALGAVTAINGRHGNGRRGLNLVPHALSIGRLVGYRLGEYKEGACIGAVGPLRA